MKSHYKSKRRHEAQYEIEDVDLPKQIISEVEKQAKQVSDNFWEQLLGLDNTSDKKGESVIFDLSNLRKSTAEKNNEVKPQKKKTKAEIQPGIDYHKEYYEGIVRFSENASSRESAFENRKIEQVMAEIRKLAVSTKRLQAEFGLITVEEAPVNPGKYYVNFFEWVLIMVKQARQKVEDSNSWLETVKGKKKKKGYWGMAKDHGTSFSQANERFVATSTG